MGELVLRSMHQHLLQEPKVVGVQCRLDRGWWGRPGDVSQIAFGLLQQRCEDEVLEVAQRDHELVTEPAQQPRALDLAPTGDPHRGLLSRITPHLELHRRLNLPGQGHVPCGGYKNVGGLYNSIAW